MSKIVKIEYDTTEQTRRKVSSVHCLWKKGDLDTGEPCVILSTINPRAKSGSVNQALHITPDVAKELIAILKKELHI